MDIDLDLALQSPLPSDTGSLEDIVKKLEVALNEIPLSKSPCHTSPIEPDVEMVEDTVTVKVATEPAPMEMTQAPPIPDLRSIFTCPTLEFRRLHPDLCKPPQVYTAPKPVPLMDIKF